MSESFFTAAFLSVSGGLQDAYTYISRGKVFANAQTGNIVLFSESIVDGNWPLTLRYLIPLTFFAIGTATAEIIRLKYQNVQKIHWRQLILLVEILLLFFVGFMPERFNLIANAIVSFSCAMQVQAFRKVNGHAFASTMCIGNLRSGMEALCDYAQTKEKALFYKALCYFGIIFMFGFGAGLGKIFITWIGMRAIWASCVLLFAGFLIMFIKEKTDEF